MVRKIRLVGVVLIFALAISSSAFAAPKEDDGLQKVTFVHYVKSHGRAGTPTDEVADYKLISGGVKLAANSKYKVDTTGAPNGTGTAIAASVDEWQRYTANDPILGVDAASTNVLLWSRLQAGTIAVTQMWINTRTKTIVKFTITFNDYYGWSTSRTGQANMMDVQNIATHELGHALGLSDLYNNRDSELTMYGYSDFADIDKRTLGLGDALGAQRLFGTGAVWVTGLVAAD